MTHLLSDGSAWVAMRIIGNAFAFAYVAFQSQFVRPRMKTINCSVPPLPVLQASQLAIQAMLLFYKLL